LQRNCRQAREDALEANLGELDEPNMERIEEILPPVYAPREVAEPIPALGPPASLPVPPETRPTAGVLELTPPIRAPARSEAWGSLVREPTPPLWGAPPTPARQATPMDWETPNAPPTSTHAPAPEARQRPRNPAEPHQPEVPASATNAPGWGWHRPGEQLALQEAEYA
jgi:hypothetical protein